MQVKDSKGSRALGARGFVALWAVVALAAAFGARPGEAAPFAYVANNDGNSISTVSVIDTATNKLVATVTVGVGPTGVAVTPEGTLAYVANLLDDTVSVINTATNTVVATVVVPPGVNGFSGPNWVAVTPDGKYAYVADQGSSVSVIDTYTNTVVATVPVGKVPYTVAITPDGKYAYVTDIGANSVAVIKTATNTVVATVPVGNSPIGVAITPDGKRAYVGNQGDSTVSVINTATNTVVATVTVPAGANGVAVTPDGKHVYTGTSFGGTGTAAVIDTATNTVVATVPVGANPYGVGIILPPPGIPFSAFSAKLAIQFGKTPNRDFFELQYGFTLGSASNGINPVAEAVTLQVGTFTTTIPPGSFKGKGFGPFVFVGVINGVALEVLITPTGAKRYALVSAAQNAILTGTFNTVFVTLTIGDDSGVTSVTAKLRAL